MCLMAFEPHVMDIHNICLPLSNGICSSRKMRRFQFLLYEESKGVKNQELPFMEGLSFTVCCWWPYQLGFGTLFSFWLFDGEVPLRTQYQV